MPKEFARRFPTDTAMEVYSPTNPPPSPVESMAHGDLSDMPDTGGSNSDHDPRYIKLDQTTPQTVTGGSPLFNGGITLNATTITTDSTTGLKVGDSSQKIAFLGAAPIVRQANTIDLGTVLSNFGLRTAGTAYPITTSGAVAFSGTIGLSGQVTVGNAINFAINTSTGTKFGTATTQKIGFFNATPIVQPVATLDLGTVLSNLGFRAAGTAYPITTSGIVTLTGATTITLSSSVAFKVASATVDVLTVDTSIPKIIVGGTTHQIGFTGDESMIVLTTDVVTINDDLKVASDSYGVWVGAGSDAKITYDGTNMIINPKVVGSGYLSIAGDLNVNANDIYTTGAVKGVHKAADGTAAVADGTYTTGIGGTTNGTITIKDGIITAVQQAVA